MNARQCKRCGKLFQYVSTPICQRCVKELDMVFAKVRDYIYDNPGANIDEVCEATEVDASMIRYWLKEGRLLLSSGSPITLSCEQCGAPIISGTKCDACVNKLRENLKSAADSIKLPVSKTSKPSGGGRDKDKMRLDHTTNRKI